MIKENILKHYLKVYVFEETILKEKKKRGKLKHLSRFK